MQKEPVKGYSGRVKVPRPTPPGDVPARVRPRKPLVPKQPIPYDEEAMTTAYTAYDSVCLESPMQAFLEDNVDGDGLAVFVAREIYDVTGPEPTAASALEGVRAMEKAMADLRRVRDALAKLWIKRKDAKGN